MGKRRMSLVVEAVRQDLEDPKPYEFSHNQPFREWFAWKCQGCGVVRLEDERTGFEAWMCEVCRVRFNS